MEDAGALLTKVHEACNRRDFIAFSAHIAPRGTL
jgi:hypothetical protein